MGLAFLTFITLRPPWAWGSYETGWTHASVSSSWTSTARLSRLARVTVITNRALVTRGSSGPTKLENKSLTNAAPSVGSLVQGTLTEGEGSVSLSSLKLTSLDLLLLVMKTLFTLLQNKLP